MLKKTIIVVKALEKSNNDGASGSGATTLPRNISVSDYDGRESHHSNSLDKRGYVPNYMGEFDVLHFY